MKTAFRMFLLFFVMNSTVWASDIQHDWYSKNANKIVINVEMFLSSTCPHCKKADTFFRELEEKSSDLHVQRYFINQDKDALIRFNQLLNAQQMDDFAVPSIYFCNSRWVGFANAQTTGKDLLQSIDYCRQQIEKYGKLTQSTVDTLRHLSNANKYATGLVGKPARWFYTVSVALIDAFNPCALFCFAGFLAFLLIEEQRKKQIIAGLLFIFSIGVVHYFQQIYTGTFFELLSWLRIPAALLGCLTLYFVLSYPKSKYSDYLYFILAFLLGLVTTIYQQTCLMRWAIIFEQWLNNQNIPSWQSGLYQLLYQSLYILPLIFFLIVYLHMMKKERFVAMRIKLASIGLLFLIAIALSLIVYPYVLSYSLTSVLILSILVVCGFFLKLT
jgi:thiol-disulfide isomerase/thioredoxin